MENLWAGKTLKRKIIMVWEHFSKFITILEINGRIIFYFMKEKMHTVRKERKIQNILIRVSDLNNCFWTWNLNKQKIIQTKWRSKRSKRDNNIDMTDSQYRIK